MSEARKYIESLFLQKSIIVASNRTGLFDEYVKEETAINAVNQIQENQKKLMANWELRVRIKDIAEKQLIIPNGTVGKSYEAPFDFIKLGMDQMVYTEFEGLEQYGLVYNNETESITGTPTQSGDFKVKMKFRVTGEADDSILNEKVVSLVINANPKSLWKDIPSTQTDDNYWKPDTASDFQQLGDKHIVVASKRGRSHANVGSFREDDFAFKYFEKTGWSVICVADGAGSATLARQGSKIACESIIDYFTDNFTAEILAEFDNLIKGHKEGTGEDVQKKLNLFVYNNLGKAAFAAHKKLEEFANKIECPLESLNTTLIFSLFKKYGDDYAILSFGVGDCPISLLNKEMTEVKLMNWLDVGEFGGGTRFITDSRIFKSDQFQTRFGFKLIQDFSYLMLMTDGIYDAKFVVEANLDKIEKWGELIDDLNGKNAENAKVELQPENTAIAEQLSVWMDFWSPGNHDDRTLAIVF